MFYVCMYNIDVWLDISIYACGITLGHYAKLCVINLVALLLIYFITHTHKFYHLGVVAVIASDQYKKMVFCVVKGSGYFSSAHRKCL